MREILFRGKVDVDPEWLGEMGLTLEQYVTQHIPSADFKDGWVYGQVVYDKGKTRAWIVGPIIDWGDEWLAHEWWMPVKPETVGQYTGFKDKNGTKIFEGDILEYTYFDGVAERKHGKGVCKSYNEIIWAGLGWALQGPGGTVCDILLTELLEDTVVVNKWDNPELEVSE